MNTLVTYGLAITAVSTGVAAFAYWTGRYRRRTDRRFRSLLVEFAAGTLADSLQSNTNNLADQLAAALDAKAELDRRVRAIDFSIAHNAAGDCQLQVAAEVRTADAAFVAERATTIAWAALPENIRRELIRHPDKNPTFRLLENLN